VKLFDELGLYISTVKPELLIISGWRSRGIDYKNCLVCRIQDNMIMN